MTRQTPPHSPDAEASLIGAVLIRPSTMGQLRGLVDPTDFYRPQFQHVWQGMLDLWEAGAEIDPVTVKNQVGDLVEAALLHECFNATPAVSAAGRYAEIVIEDARRRALIHHYSELAHAAYTTPADRVLADAGNLPARLLTRGDGPIDGLSTLTEFMDRASQVRDQGEWLVPHILRPHWRAVVIAGEGAGKAPIACDTPTLTANRGWVSHGDLVVGDVLFDENGKPTSVTAVHPTVLDAPCSKVVFSDGAEIVCTDDHLWATITYKDRQPGGGGQMTTRPLSDIAATLKARGGHCANHAIPTTGPLDTPAADLPLDPYLLGLWLGDGSSNAALVTKPDLEVPDAFRAAGFTVKAGRPSGGGCPTWLISAGDGPGLRTILRELGVLNNKHVPDIYLSASTEQRLALLQGLMDSDGHCPTSRRGATRVEFTSTRRPLADAVMHLALSLGFKPSAGEGRAMLNGADYGPKFRVTFQPDMPVFRIPRKLGRQIIDLPTRRAKLRYIVDVVPVPPVPARCITVDSPSHLFLTGTHLIPTHNTWMRWLGLHAAAGRDPWQPTARIVPRRVLYVDCENSETTQLHQVRIANRDLDWGYECGDHYWVWNRESGINLRERRAQAEMERVLQETRPEIVLAGPLYKLSRRGKGEDMEQATIEMLEVLDDFRTRFGFALVLEHHAPKGESGARRVMTAFGSSALLRWPEFGITFDVQGNPTPGERHLTFDVGRFRMDREPADWPATITRGAVGQRTAWTGRWPNGRWPTEGPTPDQLDF